MATKELPSIDKLRKLLAYNPATGKLYWRERTPDMFEDGKATAEHKCNRWNSRYAGKEAFTSHNDGYKCGGIFSRVYVAHRVIWAMLHGAWPEEQIDHINGVRDDNRIENLRAVTHQENSKNQKVSSVNTSGHMGVSWHKEDQRWIARIGVNKKRIHLGCFTEIDDAIAARKAAEVKYGFHENHGRAG